MTRQANPSAVFVLSATVADLLSVVLSVPAGCSLHHLRLQPPSPAVTASITYVYSLHYIRLQPLLQLHTVTVSITYGCSLYRHGQSLCCIRLQPTLPTVTASVAYSYSLCNPL